KSRIQTSSRDLPGDDSQSLIAQRPPKLIYAGHHEDLRAGLANLPREPQPMRPEVPVLGNQEKYFHRGSRLPDTAAIISSGTKSSLSWSSMLPVRYAAEDAPSRFPDPRTEIHIGF